ncbi:MAG: hypothetical protein JNM90_25280 [Burkholderiales bacterium]|nr:hypothetical protein [Burkholderiales bacterium]
MIKTLHRLLACLAFAGAAGSVSADVVPVSPVGNGSALAGATATTSFNVGFGTGYELLTLDFSLTYDVPALTFNVGASKLAYNGSEYGLIAGLDQLVADSAGDFSYSTSTTPGDPGKSVYSVVGGYVTGSLVLAGPVLLKAAFDILPGAPVGAAYSVELAGLSSAVDPNPPLFVRSDSFGAGASVTVAAIPEPGGWMMLLAGLGLVATLGRRRLAARA